MANAGEETMEKSLATLSNEEEADADVFEENMPLPEPTEEEKLKIKARKRKGRRASVSAECGVVEADREFKVVKIPKTPEEIERIRKAVNSNFLFGSLTEEQKNIVFDAMKEKTVADNETIIKQGDEGDFFYVLDQGVCDVYVDGNLVLTYNAGSAFGELALMYHCPRAATVKARVASTLWMLDRMTFRHILCQNQAEKRTQYENFLEVCPLFANLGEEEIGKIADVLVDHSFAKGEIVLCEGDDDFDSMNFYLIREGDAEAVKTSKSGEETIVGLMGPGQFFGEKALMEKKPRAATVRARTDLKCASLDVAAFERLLGPCKDIMEREIANYNFSPAGTGLSAARALGESHPNEN